MQGEPTQPSAEHRTLSQEGPHSDCTAPRLEDRVPTGLLAQKDAWLQLPHLVALEDLGPVGTTASHSTSSGPLCTHLSKQLGRDEHLGKTNKCQALFLGVTLRPDVYGEKGLDISYNVSDNRTWTDLVHTLHDFLAGKVNTLPLPLFFLSKSHRGAWASRPSNGPG